LFNVVASRSAKSPRDRSLGFNGPPNKVVLFAAAHGFANKKDGRFYLIPQDYYDRPTPVSLAQWAIGQDQLQDRLANHIKAKRAVILLDTCESGALIGGHLRTRVDQGPGALLDAPSECRHKWRRSDRAFELVAYAQDRVPRLAANSGGSGRSFTAVSNAVVGQ